MTIKTNYIIHCDRPHCDNSQDLFVTQAGIRPQTNRARGQALSAFGWQFERESNDILIDICPECVAEEEKQYRLVRVNKHQDHEDETLFRVLFRVFRGEELLGSFFVFDELAEAIEQLNTVPRARMRQLMKREKK